MRRIKRRWAELDAQTVREVKLLLARGVSQRGIATKLQIGLSTITRINNGTHISESRPAVYQRCPRCRHLVVMPCLKCQLEAGGGEEDSPG